MQGVLYAAVVAAFLLGIYFINSYRRRGMRAPVPAPSASGDDDQLDVDSYAQSTRRVAEAEAASIRALAQREADAQRRAVEAELEALHRAAAADAATAKEVAERAHANAKAEAAMLLGDARAAAESEAARLTEEIRQTERDLVTQAERLADSQVALEAQAARIRDESAELDKAVQQLGVRGREQDDREADLDRRFAELEKRAVEHDRERERIAGLTAEEAKAELLASVEVGARRDAAMLVRSIENEARAEGTDRARAIVVEAVQRVASEQTAETVVSVLHLPSDEMKGRIIGREGRNIRTFESVTGVNVIIDDTPEAVLLSCFDPVRREVGRLTLDKLDSGRPDPPAPDRGGIRSSRTERSRSCACGPPEDALVEVGITDLHRELVPTLGRLQVPDVLRAERARPPPRDRAHRRRHGRRARHRADPDQAVRVPARHRQGADPRGRGQPRHRRRRIARKYGETEAVAHAIEAHHNEVPPRTVEAVLTQAADACSAAGRARAGSRWRPTSSGSTGSRRSPAPRRGVEKVFAMQAGREVRVMVQPAEVDDLAAQVIAREVAKQIEEELTYPGQIRVTVVRELRATEVAH